MIVLMIHAKNAVLTLAQNNIHLFMQNVSLVHGKDFQVNQPKKGNQSPFMSGVGLHLIGVLIPDLHVKVLASQI